MKGYLGSLGKASPALTGQVANILLCLPAAVVETDVCLDTFAASTGDLTRSYGQAAGPGEQQQQRQRGQQEAPQLLVDNAAALEDLTQVSLLPVTVANLSSSPPFSNCLECIMSFSRLHQIQVSSRAVSYHFRSFPHDFRTHFWAKFSIFAKDIEFF